MAVTVINKDNFETFTSEGTVLVDFWAEWCGPCQKMLPTLDALAAENGTVKIGKVNVDDNPELAQQFRVMSIPTIIIFKDGKPAMVSDKPAILIGAQDKATLEDYLGKIS